MRHTIDIFAMIPLTVVLCASSVHGEEYDSPFIAGFDRSARHGEIEQAVGGRLLIGELSCATCHASDVSDFAPKLGPRLNGAGDRLQQSWLRRFLAAPHVVKPGTTMPDVLGQMPEIEKQRASESLVAFLSSQHEPFPELKAGGANPLPHEFWNKGDAENGRRLYHQVGCVACHAPDQEYDGGAATNSALDRLLEQLDPAEIEEMGLAAAARPVRSVPHGDLAAKYTRRALTLFLLDPQSVRPSGRMPSLKLQPVEAADIAAYLLREQVEFVDSTDGDKDPTLVDEGRRRFIEMQCANCHSADRAKPTRLAKPLAELNVSAENSCVAAPRLGLPHFPLDDAQRASLQIALTAAPPTDDAAQAPRQVELQFLQLNCYACHERDGRGGVGRKRRAYFETAGHVDLGDEGRLPPPLTGVGRKLKTAWLKKVLAGTGDVRPYMLARMPVFPAPTIADLPSQLAAADASKSIPQTDVVDDTIQFAEAGRTLLNQGCVQCHGLRGETLPGVVGIDLAGVGGRVQRQWFHEFMLSPGQLKPRTRMPDFFPNGKSSTPDVLAGNVDRQIAAMWNYLNQMDKLPLPEKLVQARSRDFELVPQDRPILLRTFMKQAGTHAIAVGFPEQVHFAFDAENVRVAQAWRGRFLDAYGTWFVRFAPPADPLGDDVIALPAGVPLALLKDSQQSWPTDSAEQLNFQFRGYRIDRAGVPTFLYRFDRFDIEDRIEPNGERELERQLTVTQREPSDTNAGLWFRANAGKELRSSKSHSFTNHAGLTTSVSENTDRIGVVRKVDGGADWILPVAADGKSTIEVHYQW